MPLATAINPAGYGISRKQGGGSMTNKAETALQNAIRAVLSEAGIVRRNNVGTFLTLYGVPVRIGLPGESDLTWFIRNGQTIFVEIKTPDGRQSRQQKQFQSVIESYGFRYVTLRSVEDARKLIEEVKV